MAPPVDDGIATVLDLGHGHTLRFWRFAGRPKGERDGADIGHPRGSSDGYVCARSLIFDLPETAHLVTTRPRYVVVRWAPLTIAGPIRCDLCTDLGFVVDGVWVTEAEYLADEGRNV